MKEVDKRKTPNTNRTKRAGKPEKRDQKPNQGNAGKTVSGKDTQSKASHAKLDSKTVVSDSNTGTEPSEVYENVVIHYVDDVNRSEQAARALKANQKLSKEIMDDVVNDSSSELDKESKQGKEEVSDSETSKDSVSSQGDSLMAGDEKVEESVMSKKSSTERSFEGSKERSDQTKPSNQKPSSETAKSSFQGNSKNVIVHSKPSSDSSEGVDNKYVAEVQASDSLIETSNGAENIGSNNGTVDAEENGVHENEAVLEKKTEEMEARIEKLEEELREVAALEISLYSVVPEHGSSAHKVHTPARRLSRLYIHACKYWTQDKRATVARNTVSGLLLIAKSCGNDVPRLTFWLSNAVVLREIIFQAFGGSRHSSPVTWLAESNGNGTRSGIKSTMKGKGSSGSRHINGFKPCLEDWQETGTFTAALEKVESWIFSRVVESVWWQALTPYMQSPVENLSNNKNIGRLLGPALGDQTQGSFSISLWKKAFQDAAQRLCPVRAGGHECGCLPVLARMVMEQCIARLDVAMFNAILRESSYEIPTDPVSDPIVDSKVLPIPAGDLSFGSGAQLKNSVGNWSRWLTDMFGIDADDVPREDQDCNDDNDKLGGDGEPKSFLLLNSLSDLLMLPKDMLMDRSIRKEVCPSISLPLIKRILCNFTPDEFCPDPVPGAVLEALNAESIVERRLSGDSVRSFPYTVAPVVYTPPSPADVAEKCEVSDTGGRSELARNVSVVQRKGYTSDEELEELESPLLAIIDKLPLSPSTVANGNGKHKDNTGYASVNERYELLSEVWSM